MVDLSLRKAIVGYKLHAVESAVETDATLNKITLEIRHRYLNIARSMHE